MHSQYKAVVLIGMAWATLSPAMAATTLIQAWQAAQQHDPQFAAERAAWQAGLTAREQGDSLLRPQVVGVASTGKVSMNNDTEGASFTTPALGTSNQVAFRTSINHGTSNQWRIEAQMPLIDAGKWAQRHQLGASANLADARFQQARQDLILRTAKAYLALIMARDDLATLRQQQRAIDKTLREARDRFNLGDIPVTDSLEAEAQAQEMAARVLAAETELQIRGREWQDLTGLSPDALPDLNPALDAAVPSLAPLADWQARASQASPLLTMSQLGVEVARDEIDKYRAWHSPTLSLVGSVGQERLNGSGDYGPSSITTRSNMIGVQLTIPLYTGGYRSAKLAEAAQLADKAGYEQESTRQMVARATETAWLGIMDGARRTKALNMALQANVSRLKATQLGHQVGDRTTLDVLNAQTAVAQSQMQWRAAELDLMMNRLTLQAMSGQLDERELQALDGYFK